MEQRRTTANGRGPTPRGRQASLDSKTARIGALRSSWNEGATAVVGQRLAGERVTIERRQTGKWGRKAAKELRLDTVRPSHAEAGAKQGVAGYITTAFERGSQPRFFPPTPSLSFSAHPPLALTLPPHPPISPSPPQVPRHHATALHTRIHSFSPRSLTALPASLSHPTSDMHTSTIKHNIFLRTSSLTSLTTTAMTATALRCHRASPLIYARQVEPLSSWIHQL